MRSRRSGAMGAALILALPLLAACSHTTPGGGVSSGTHFYVDAGSGDDAAAGTSANHPWRTFKPLAGRTLGPGAEISLAKGSRYTAPLSVEAHGTSAQPVRIDAYGSGAAPLLTVASGDPSSCVQIAGSWAVVENLHVSACGWAGVEVTGSDITVRGVEADGSAAGVAAADSSRRATITGNTIHDNDKMTVNTPEPRDDDSGAFGVALLGSDAVVTDNTISGCHAASYDFGTDGSGVEVYDAAGSTVARNTIRDCQSGIELGGTKTSDTMIAYNVITDAAADTDGVVTRGSGVHFGPVRKTSIVNNTILLQGANSQGMSCDGNCQSGIVDVINDVISAPAAVAGGGASMDYCIVFGDRSDVRSGNHVTVLATPWTDATAAPPGAVGKGTGVSLPQAATPSGGTRQTIGAVG